MHERESESERERTSGGRPPSSKLKAITRWARRQRRGAAAAGIGESVTSDYGEQTAPREKKRKDRDRDETVDDGTRERKKKRRDGEDG